MKNSSVKLQITVKSDTLAEMDLLAVRLSLISGVDWDITNQMVETTLSQFSKPLLLGLTSECQRNLLPGRN